MKCVCLAILLFAALSFGSAQESAPATARKKDLVAPKPNSSEPQQSGIEAIDGKVKVFPDIAEEKEPPLSAGGKFKLFLVKSTSPGNLAGAALGAGIGQGIDAPEGYGQGGTGYGKRFGAGLATGASKSFFGNFLIPTLLHHDPRFYPQGDGSFRQSLKFAFRRTVITRSDSGEDAFNWSGILAPIAAQSIANSYLPEEERTVGKTFARSARTIGISVGVNLLKEYWPSISKKFKRNKTAQVQFSGAE